jgi:hypothetical protein
MRKNQFIIGIILGMGLAMAVSSADAKDKQFHANFAGSDIFTADFSFDGRQPGADDITVTGKSMLGEYTAHAVAEVAPDGNSCTLPGGGSGVELVHVGKVFVLSFAERGENLFLTLSPSVTSHMCLDPVPFTASGQVTFDVSGGTGRFAGATGTIVETFEFIGLAPPASPPGRGGFASLTGTFDGTIKLAK